MRLSKMSVSICFEASPAVFRHHRHACERHVEQSPMHQTKTARAVSACRCCECLIKGLAARRIARHRINVHIDNGLMRCGKTRRVVDDACGSWRHLHGDARTCTNACAANNGGHRLAVEFDTVGEVFDSELCHGGSRETIEPAAGAIGQPSPGCVYKCAEVSSHYQYRKSACSSPAGYEQAAVGKPPVLRYCMPLNVGVIGGPQRRADIQIQWHEAGADHADVVERGNIDGLNLAEVLVHRDVDIGDAAKAGYGGQPGNAAAGAAGHRRHCAAVELAGAG